MSKPCTVCIFKDRKPDGFWWCWVHSKTIYNPANAGCKYNSKLQPKRVIDDYLDDYLRRTKS